MPPRPKAKAASAPAAAKPADPPSYWSSSSGINIIPNMERMTEMQDLVTQTWRAKFTRDRKATGSTKVPTGARVLMVLRVENHECFQKYAQHREGIRSCRRDDCPPFPVATNGALSAYDMAADVNEMFLFHGTSPLASDAIARSDFRLDKAGSAVGTMFGPGIYLAENASKSDEYAKEGDGVFMGQCALLLCRAAAGKVFTTPDKGDARPHVASGAHDSVCGDRLAAVGTFREMIFFAESAVCTEFIILYARSFDEIPTGPSGSLGLAAPVAPAGPSLAAPVAATPAAAPVAAPKAVADAAPVTQDVAQATGGLRALVLNPEGCALAAADLAASSGHERAVRSAVLRGEATTKATDMDQCWQGPESVHCPKEKAKAGVGQDWTRVGIGFHVAVGTDDFVLTLRFKMLWKQGTAAAVWFDRDSQYVPVGFREKGRVSDYSILLDQPRLEGGWKDLCGDGAALSPNEIHTLVVARRSGVCAIALDGKQAFPLLPMDGSIEKIALRPWRNKFEVYDFYLTEMAPSGQPTREIPLGDGVAAATLTTVNPEENARTYSSIWGAGTGARGAKHGRDAKAHALSMIDSAQAWSSNTIDQAQWMIINLGCVESVKGVVTQGRAQFRHPQGHYVDQYVKTFNVEYSRDGSKWVAVSGTYTSGQQANKVQAIFPAVVQAQYVKILPQTWNLEISMRAAVLVEASAADTTLCKMGCGRAVAPSVKGRTFDTCCRKCASGEGHSYSCRAGPDAASNTQADSSEVPEVIQPR